MKNKDKFITLPFKILSAKDIPIHCFNKNDVPEINLDKSKLEDGLIFWMDLK